ncbi:hypothetical protein NPS01_11910 [Nocardioides psychrotolerans]|uniref:DUF4333 domain-containing protein n=1 Tax=Nocardioides psychrotolerans TaxID=1005945 RepID=A0A1I3E3A9_9ACTN|nr:hypothetical protein NPS01_11910 [Nocardioides psychrotolerans]SFH93466.1 protein of unknown function [Nocardioides psychrotolerans]
MTVSAFSWRAAARRPVSTAAATALLATLSACGEPPEDAAAPSISQSELESQVAGMYPAKDDTTTVRVTCEGELPATRGAAEECRVQVDRQRATVRVSVTEVVAEEVRIDSVLVVSADRVAQELLEALTGEEFVVDEVVCPDELLGRVGEQLTCTVTPNTGSGKVIATVTKIRGLRVDFDYAVAP